MNRNTYWEDEDNLLCFFISYPDERYVIDHFHRTIKKEYRMMGKYEAGVTLDIEYPATIKEAMALVEADFSESEKKREEFEQEIWNDIAQEEMERHKKRDAWKKTLKGLINTKRLWEDQEDNTDWDIEGIVEVELTDEKRSNYPSLQCARVKDDKSKLLYMISDREKWERWINHTYVWQQTGYLGDDYSGFLLYPLKDGKYLQIRYAC